MGGKGKEAAQRILAIIVIIAMMSAMGIKLPVIVFFALVIYFVWRAVQHTERQETNRIFDFYVAANDILRDDERRWYGFEVAGVTNEGERILRDMADAPPLLSYALGALYHRIGDFANAHEHLAALVESETGDESRRLSGSIELRRYVETLRRLERDPAEKPQTMAAIRSLERGRRAYARPLLDETRISLAAAPVAAAPVNLHAAQFPVEPMSHRDADAAPSLLTYIASANHGHSDTQSLHDVNAGAHRHSRFASSATENVSSGEVAHAGNTDGSGEHGASNKPRGTITEVLHDVYEEEKRTA
jgi:hypothetical protein